jgi:hypothetical protein
MLRRLLAQSMKVTLVVPLLMLLLLMEWLKA